MAAGGDEETEVEEDAGRGPRLTRWIVPLTMAAVALLQSVWPVAADPVAAIGAALTDMALRAVSRNPRPVSCPDSGCPHRTAGPDDRPRSP